MKFIWLRLSQKRFSLILYEDQSVLSQTRCLMFIILGGNLIFAAFKLDLLTICGCFICEEVKFGCFIGWLCFEKHGEGRERGDKKLISWKWRSFHLEEIASNQYWWWWSWHDGIESWWYQLFFNWWGCLLEDISYWLHVDKQIFYPNQVCIIDYIHLHIFLMCCPLSPSFPSIKEGLLAV